MKSGCSYCIAIGLLVGVACGGKIEEDAGGDRRDTASPPTANEQRPAAPRWGGSDRTKLPDCEPGFELGDEPDRSCDWFADGLCYSDKLVACACVCPPHGGSTCLSGFPEENGRVEVYCP